MKNSEQKKKRTSPSPQEESEQSRLRRWWKKENKILLMSMLLIGGVIAILVAAKIHNMKFLLSAVGFFENPERTSILSFTALFTALGWLIGIYYLDKRARLFQKQIEEQQKQLTLQQKQLTLQQKQIAQQQTQHQENFYANHYQKAIAHMAEQNEQAGIVGFSQIRSLLDQLEKENAKGYYVQYRRLSFDFLCDYLRMYTQSEDYLAKYYPRKEGNEKEREGKPGILVQNILDFLIPKTGNKDSHHFSDSNTFRLQLSGAQLQGADLGLAEMQGADFSHARMQRVDLRLARLQGAILGEAQMQGADLREAQMQGAILDLAQMQGANLFRTGMQRAEFYHAQLQGANLGVAQMQGAYFSGAQMQGADLREAQMQGADLREAQLQGANLCYARMQGANLGGAQMQGIGTHNVPSNPDLLMNREDVQKFLQQWTANLEGIVFYDGLNEKWPEKNKGCFTKEQYEKLRKQIGEKQLIGTKGGCSRQDEKLQVILHVMGYISERKLTTDEVSAVLKVLEYKLRAEIVSISSEERGKKQFTTGNNKGWLGGFDSYEKLREKYKSPAAVWVEYSGG